MGNKSHEKTQRKINAAVAAALAAASSAGRIGEESGISLRGWLRATGSGAFLIGGIGMMSTFFWFSISLVYLGISIWFIDVCLERFAWAWVRWALLAILFSSGCALTHYIVLRNDPILVEYSGYADFLPNDHGVLNIFVTNDTDVDYRGVDFHVILPSDHYVIKSWQISNLTSCSVYPIKQGNALKDEHILKTYNDDPRIAAEYIGNYQRIRCDVLPHRSVLQVGIIVREGSNSKIPIGHPSTIEIRGSYKGKFRDFDMPADVSLVTDAEPGWTQP